VRQHDESLTCEVLPQRRFPTPAPMAAADSPAKTTGLNPRGPTYLERRVSVGPLSCSFSPPTSKLPIVPRNRRAQKRPLVYFTAEVPL
jgi:hypothetical protein